MTHFGPRSYDVQLLDGFPYLNRLTKYREPYIQTLWEIEKEHRIHALDRTAHSIPANSLMRFGRRGFEAVNHTAGGLIRVSSNWHYRGTGTGEARCYWQAEELGEFSQWPLHRPG